MAKDGASIYSTITRYDEYDGKGCWEVGRGDTTSRQEIQPELQNSSSSSAGAARPHQLHVQDDDMTTTATHRHRHPAATMAGLLDGTSTVRVIDMLLVRVRVCF